MKILNKIFYSVSLLVAFGVGFTSCKAPKEISANTSQIMEDNLTIKKQQDSTLTTENTITPFECLPQDKPFLDSLYQNLFKLKNGGYNQTYTLIDTIPSIIQKLFPNVIFYKNVVWISIYSEGVLSAYYNRQEYVTVISSFNYLFKEIHQVHAYNLDEKLRAFLYMTNGFNSTITIKSIETADINIPNIIYTFNYETEVNINGENIKCVFFIENDQILSFIQFDQSGNIIKIFEIHETSI